MALGDLFAGSPYSGFTGLSRASPIAAPLTSGSPLDDEATELARRRQLLQSDYRSLSWRGPHDEPEEEAAPMEDSPIFGPQFLDAVSREDKSDTAQWMIQQATGLTRDGEVGRFTGAPAGDLMVQFTKGGERKVIARPGTATHRRQQEQQRRMDMVR